MRLDDEQESGNFEIQQGGRGFGMPGLGGGLPFGGGKIGCGTLAIIVVLAMVMGVNPLQLLSGGGPGGNAPVETVQNPGELTEVQRLSLRVLGSTERRWSDLFARAGQTYRPAVLVFYSGNGQSGCGAAQAAMGPFYCPADQKIYLDTSFFEELKSRFGAPGDFAQAYVIAHEVGHHIQYLTGKAEEVRQAQARVGERAGNALQVKMELQADCYAGVWAANDENLLEAGDIEEGMRAAHQIGDDVLQKAAQGYVVEAAFTHGSAEQRMTWLKRGLESGDPAACDTFGQ